MKISDSQAITDHLSGPTTGKTRVFLSSLRKGLEDCRLATNRDRVTGEKLTGTEHDSWVGALGYLALLDQIGTCFCRKGMKPDADEFPNALAFALKTFGRLSERETAAIYALRCAFAHDFSLFNVHEKKPELTHCFRLFGQTNEPMVQLPATPWNGDYANRSPECFTAVGLTLLGDLVESICTELQVLAQDNELEIALPGGAEELIYRYGIMKQGSTG